MSLCRFSILFSGFCPSFNVLWISFTDLWSPAACSVVIWVGIHTNSSAEHAVVEKHTGLLNAITWLISLYMLFKIV